MKRIGMKMMVVAVLVVCTMAGTPASALASEGWWLCGTSGVSVQCAIADRMLLSGTPMVGAAGIAEVDPVLSGRYESASGDQRAMVVTSFSQYGIDTFRGGRDVTVSIENRAIESLMASDVSSGAGMARVYAYNVNTSGYDALASAS